MALPVVPLPTGVVEIAGAAVPYRSLSRSEVTHIMTALKGDPEGGQLYILSRGAGITEDEAQAWLDETDATTAGLLIDAIVIITGLASPEQVQAANERGEQSPPA